MPQETSWDWFGSKDITGGNKVESVHMTLIGLNSGMEDGCPYVGSWRNEID